MSSQALRSYLRTLRAEQRITQRQLAQAERVNPALNAVVQQHFAAAYDDARHADADVALPNPCAAQLDALVQQAVR